jgi:hypothetical protein
MAAIQIYVRFSDTPRVDGLCPKCWKPALRQYILQNIDLDGITTLGTRTACSDCHIWVEPLQKANQ